ncbi:hypothetical protein [Kordia jejudonensis]|uniref:hypothetical protein n=1 Tax=Kordia jejudonensis TaxID=1348245 RepID=UPI0012E00A61|nr:hypothetical protein [Kordia jejudonensis]
MLEKFNTQTIVNAYYILGGITDSFDDIIFVDDINALNCNATADIIGIGDVDTA